MREKKAFKEYIFLLKGWAIFCVVCAHTGNVLENASYINVLCSKVFNYLGTMGVPIFFLISGFLYEGNNKSFFDFWKKKVKSIFIPWIICATLLWLYVVIRKGGISIQALIKFIIGYGHSTYYLTMLCVMYLIFWFFKKDWQIIIAIGISIFSIISTGWSTGISFINDWTGNYYLNVLNWMSFFCGGILLRRKEPFWDWIDTLTDKKIVWYSLSIVYFAICLINECSIWYFSEFSLLGHSINILMGISLAKSIANKKQNIVVTEIGKYSYSIFLLHQFFTGIIVVVTNMMSNLLLVLVRPFLVIIIVMVMIRLILFVNDKRNDRFNFIKVIIGVR